MTSVQQRQEQRTDYLVALYELANGTTSNLITNQAIADESGLAADNSIMEIAQALHDGGMIRMVTTGGLMGMVEITSAGLREAERVLVGQQETGQAKYFAAVVLDDRQLLVALEPLVAAIRQQLDALADKVDPLDKADLNSDLESANDQLRAARPNRGVLRAALTRINDVLPKVASATAQVAAVVGSISDILRSIGH